MSSSDRTPLVQIVANEPERDPAAEHARRITELASSMDEAAPSKRDSSFSGNQASRIGFCQPTMSRS